MKRLLLVFLSVLSLIALVGCAQEQSTTETETPSLQAEITLNSPSDGITIVNRTPTFSWTSSIEASSYSIQVSVERSFDRPMIDEEVIGTSYTITTGGYKLPRAVKAQPGPRLRPLRQYSSVNPAGQTFLETPW
jgi:hypothetical protein